MFLTAPLLTYDILHDPDPLLASPESGNLNIAKLTAQATNLTGSDVDLQGIVIQLPVGSGPDSLTVDASGIKAIAPRNWILASTENPTGFVQYVFHPLEGFGTLPKRESLAFVLNNIEVNRRFGSFRVEITEGSGHCEEEDCPKVGKYLSKWPNGTGRIKFHAHPTNLPYQGSTTLDWDGPSGATYTIQYMKDGIVVNIPKPGDPPLANRGQYPGTSGPPLTLSATTIFTLNVSQRIDNEELEDQTYVPVTVAPAPVEIETFHGSVAVDGSQLRLKLDWITESDQVSITNVPGIQKPSDSLIIRPSPGETLASTYTLEARKGDAAATSTISILWTGYKSALVAQLPVSCAILPDGSRLFSTNRAGLDISVLNPVTLAKISGPPFRSGRSWSIVASPDSTRVYVAFGSAIAPADHLDGYDSQNFRPVSGSAAKVPSFISRIAVTPDNRRIYVSGTEGVLVYDSNIKPVQSISGVGNTGSGGGIAFAPDGSRAFVTMGHDAVSVIDTARLRQETTLGVGTRPDGVAVTPGGHLYVCNSGSDSVSVFDAVTLQQLPGSPIAVAGGPMRVAPSPDGKLIFALTTAPPRLNVIDTATRTLVGWSGTGNTPVDLAVSPDGIRVFVLLGGANHIREMWMFLPAATGGTG